MPKNKPAEIKSPIAPNNSVKVTIPWATVQVSYNKILTRAAQNVKVDGFRKGKVPVTVAEQYIDQNKLYEAVIQEVLPVAYAEQLKTEKISPISQPEVDPIQMGKNQDWVFTVSFATQPQIDLGDYQKITKKALQEAEKEITEAEKKLQEETEKKPQDKAEESVTADEKKDQPAQKPTQLTDHQKEDIRLKHVFRDLVEAIQPSIPEILVRSEVNRELQRLGDQLQQLRLSVDDYLKSRQMTIEQVRNEYTGMAVSSLQVEFILGAVAKDQKLTVSDAEIDEMLNKIAEGKLSSAQRQDPDYRSYIFSTLLKQKVISFLMSLK